MFTMKKIGIIGCGVIGKAIAEFIQKTMKKRAKVIALSDIDSKKAKALSRKITPRPVITDINDLIRKSDLVVEAAGVGCSGNIARKSVSLGKDVLVMSTGGLLKDRSLLKKARTKRGNIYIPSGAICGLDGLMAAGMGKIKSVRLTTRKPPKGLEGSPGFKFKAARDVKKETVLYDGNAEQAVKYFPKNINVAATLSLAGIGPRRTRVKIVTSPLYTRNIHEIEIRGEFGRIFTRTENVPSEKNPKTSRLAIFSALSKLDEVI